MKKKIRMMYIRVGRYDTTQAIPRALSCLKDQAYHVDIIEWRKDLPGNNVTTFALDNNITVHSMNRVVSPQSLSSLFGIIKFIGLCLSLINSTKPSFIQVFETQIAAIIGIYCKIKKIKMIFDMRDPSSISYTGRPVLSMIFKVLELIASHLSCSMILPTERYLPYVSSSAKKKPILIFPNTTHDFVDKLHKSIHPELENIDSDWTVLLYLGYITPIRGSDWLIEFVSDSSHKTKLVVLGDIIYPSLKNKILNSENVLYIERVERLEALNIMSQVDAVTLLYDPSIQVNQVGDPNKFYEAMMVGTPIIASDGMSMSKLIQDNGLGFTVKHNSMDGLADVVKQLRDDDWVTSVKHRCRKYYEDNLRLSKFENKYVEFYRSLFNNKV